jgi:protein-tyrosine phosphatase
MFEGIDNFRDIGGPPAAGGGRVRCGCLYRSGRLSQATETDTTRLDGLGIDVLFDLRTVGERRDQPSRWQPAAPARLIVWEDVLESQASHYLAAASEAELVERVTARMHEYYRGAAHHHAEKFAQVLRELEQVSCESALIHCVSGKDRTGIAVALLLYVLGVEQRWIMEDYLLSNRGIDTPEKQARFIRMLKHYGIDSIDPERARFLASVQAAYLDAAFAGMRQMAGSLDDYVHDTLGVTDAMVATLRRKFLE